MDHTKQNCSHVIFLFSGQDGGSTILYYARVVIFLPSTPSRLQWIQSPLFHFHLLCSMMLFSSVCDSLVFLFILSTSTLFLHSKWPPPPTLFFFFFHLPQAQFFFLDLIIHSHTPAFTHAYIYIYICMRTHSAHAYTYLYVHHLFAFFLAPPCLLLHFSLLTLQYRGGMLSPFSLLFSPGPCASCFIIQAATAPVQQVQVFGRKKTATAVALCKRGKGVLKLNGFPIDLLQPETLRTKVIICL